MPARFLAASLGLLVAMGMPGDDPAKPDSGSSSTPRESKGHAPKGKAGARGKAAKGAADASDSSKAPQYEYATFGGGCFWCLEAVFEHVKGVKSVVSGFAGGNVPRPSYEDVCTGLTGHAEVVQVEFDPKVVSYEKLLDIFWMSHDPTTLNRQGPDFGTQYRSIILYHSDAQKKAAKKSYDELVEAHAFPDPIVTQLVPLKKFYPAEKYHQNYYRRHPYEPYSQMWIAPKVQKLRQKLANESQAH